MKKLLSIISFLLALQCSYSQNIAVTYTAPFPGVSQDVLNLPLGNNLFYVYNSQGLTFQKNNLNGTPTLIKKYQSASMSLSHLISKNGFLYAIGKKTNGASQSADVPYIFIVDTANFNMQYSSLYDLTFPNIAWVNIYDAKFLNSGNILMAGSINSYSTSNTIAWAMEINPNTNGTVVNTNTLSIGTSTTNYITSFAEISNSTIMFSGYGSNAGGFLAKATRSAGNLTFNSVYQTSVGGGVLNSFGNPKKILINQFINGGSDAIIKLDTNLALLSMISQSGIARIGANYYGTNLIKVENNKLYRLNNNKTLDIIDTSLTSIATRTMTVSNPMLMNSLNITNSNVYMLGSTLYDIFALVKTDLQGNLSCSNSIPYTNSIFQTNGGTTAFNSGSILAPLSYPAATSQTSSVTYSLTCGTITSIKSYTNNEKNIIRYLNGDYIINANTPIQSIELFDLTGKLIKQLNYLNNENEIKISLKDITSGIYLLKIIGTDKAENIYKILVN